MHSSGRGEETPEPYRGVVLPAGQQPPPPPYGEHVQPAGGTPWGDPAQGAEPQYAPHGAEPQPQPQYAPPQGAEPQPPYPQGVEPADATQMLPPYPGGTPAPGAPVPPVADATQMLPPYPASAPPPPQQAPPQQQQAPQQPPHQAAEAPAEATQAMPLSIFQDQPAPDPFQQPQAFNGQEYGEQQQFPGEQQQYAGQQQYGADQQSYGGQQQYADPPSYGGQQQYAQPGFEEQAPQQTGPQHDSDYDHLFRNDVPAPTPVRQRIIQPPSAQQQQQQQAPQQAYGQPPFEPGYGDNGYAGYDGDQGGRRGMSPKVLIGIVVAGCVVAGLVVGGLMNSGGKSDADKKNPKATVSAAAPSASTSAGGKPAAGDSAAEQQAKALDSLLNTSGASRSSVVSAVESIRNCKNLDGSASDLRAAQTQRQGLVTQLGTLAVDKLPNHDDLTTALTKAWQASAAADGHYAGWADQAANGNACKGGHARTTGESQEANKQSGIATTQKKAAVKLWNSIAKQYGLTERQFSQL